MGENGDRLTESIPTMIEILSLGTCELSASSLQSVIKRLEYWTLAKNIYLPDNPQKEEALPLLEDDTFHEKSISLTLEEFDMSKCKASPQLIIFLAS